MRKYNTLAMKWLMKSIVLSIVGLYLSGRAIGCHSWLSGAFISARLKTDHWLAFVENVFTERPFVLFGDFHSNDGSVETVFLSLKNIRKSLTGQRFEAKCWLTIPPKANKQLTTFFGLNQKTKSTFSYYPFLIDILLKL